MAHSLTEQLLAATTAFVSGQISLREFRQQTMPVIYTADQTNDPEAEYLADELILRFAEGDHGDWTDDALREYLRAYLQEEWSDLYQEIVAIVTNTPSAFADSFAVLRRASITSVTGTNPATLQAPIRLIPRGFSRSAQATALA